MGDVILDLLPVAVAAMAVPIYTIIALILLQSEGGLKKAIALMGGAVTMRLLQGLLFSFIFGEVAEEYPEAGPDILVSTLLLVLGILLLNKAYQAWRKETDPEDSPPKWMAAVHGITALKAAGVGALYVLASPKQWVFTQSAIGIIVEAESGAASDIGLYLFYVVATQISVLVPVLMVAIAPQQAVQPLKAAHDWLGRHNQTILMVVALVFGIWFTIRGINGLIN